MKNAFIGLMVLGSITAFAKDPSFMVSYGPVKDQLKNLNFQIFVDSKIPLAGREDIIAERCFDILKEMSKEQSGLHGFLLLNDVGETNGVCLIKASLNY